MKAINIAFPLEDDPQNGRFLKTSRTTRQAVKSRLLLLLYSQKGQRYYRPDWGINIRRYLFEPNDELTRTELVEDIKNTVQRFLPNISVSQVNFHQEEINGQHMLTLHVDFQYTDAMYDAQDSVRLTFNIPESL